MMNREIKFRAWVKSRNEMRENISCIKGEPFVYNSVTLQALPLNGAILMQYTGFKDKNGLELYYDCDLLTLDGFDGIWKATKDRFDIPCFVHLTDSFDCVGFDEQFLSTPEKRADGFEIIGNIHQNPYLLK